MTENEKYSLVTYYDLCDKPLLEEIIKHLEEEVFSYWAVIPTFRVEIAEHIDDACCLVMEYDRPYDHDTVNYGHQAQDLAEGFISGWMLAKKQDEKGVQ